MTDALFVIMLIIGLGFVVAGLLGAPWVPTFSRDVDAVLDDAKLASGDVFVELGCGDGRLVRAAARRGAKQAVGYEINPLMWLVAWLLSLPYRNARIVLGDLWRADLARADVVMIFLMPQFMNRLETKLERELAPGSRAVTYVYTLPHKKPVNKRHHWSVYHY